MTTIAETTTSSLVASAIEAFATHVRTARARRAQRITLVTLMDMDAGQLDDLGLNVQDVMDALAAPPPASRVLESRRAARSAGWNAKKTPLAAGHALSGRAAGPPAMICYCSSSRGAFLPAADRRQPRSRLLAANASQFRVVNAKAEIDRKSEAHDPGDLG